VSIQDDGFIHFPSMTVCKKSMYDQYPESVIQFLERNISSSTNIKVRDIKSWVYEHTYNRTATFKMFSHKTNGGPTQHVCNTEKGTAENLSLP
jgi:hypothetical protein